MHDRCGINGVKFYLGVSNFIFAISGVLILTTGILVWLDFSDYRHFLEPRIVACPIILIVSGCISIILFIVGCHGTVKEDFNTLIAFSVVLVILFILEAAVVFLAVWFMLSSDNFKVSFKNTLENALKSHTPLDQQTWLRVQENLECCGVHNFTDWYTSLALEKPRLHVSCCKREKIQPGQNCHIDHKWKIHEAGCLRVLEEHIGTCGMILLVVSAIVAVSKIFGVIFSCWFAAIVRKARGNRINLSKTTSPF